MASKQNFIISMGNCILEDSQMKILKEIFNKNQSDNIIES